MTVRPVLGSMAMRVFVILLLGMIGAASLAWMAADLQRRVTDAAAADQRTLDRAADLAAYIGALPAASPLRNLGAGPEAPRRTSRVLAAHEVDGELTQRLAHRLGSQMSGEVSQILSQGCGEPLPGPPSPRLLSASGTPAAPPPPAGPPHRAVNPAGDGAPACRLVSLQRTSGEIVTVVLPGRGPSPSQTPPGIWPLAILGAGSLVLAWFVSRLATAPLQRLARAASGLGDDIDRPALVTNGPEEVREAARAFNRMQTRLQDTLRERTFMLAAITHDLQTPLTRHRLRLEQVEDPVLRNQLLLDQSDMQTLIRNGLELARASGSPETREPLDIDSLLTSLAEDALDAGHVAQVVAVSGALIATHPSALRRCLANLMDNAIKYAGSVEIGAACHAGQIVLQVLD
ncbi:MAG: HAMP domain-containing protein, partial [Caulobacteraceae bacterium]